MYSLDHEVDFQYYLIPWKPTTKSVQFVKNVLLSNHNYVFAFRLLIETVLKYTRFISPIRNPNLKLKSPKYYTIYSKIVKYMKIHFIFEGHFWKFLNEFGNAPLTSLWELKSWVVKVCHLHRE